MPEYIMIFGTDSNDLEELMGPKKTITEWISRKWAQSDSIHSSNKYVSSAFYEPGIMLSGNTGNTKKQTYYLLCLWV